MATAADKQPLTNGHHLVMVVVHLQVRLKLLPLLLEWDVRQGPRPSSLSGVQFRPTSIRQVSAKGAEDGIKGGG